MNLAVQSLAATPVVGAWTVEMVLILVALAGAVTFVIIYPILSHPRRWIREGWHMWTFTLALVSLGGTSITRRLWPESTDHPAYTAVTLVTFTLLAVLMWQRVYLLLTARRHDRILHEKRRRP